MNSERPRVGGGGRAMSERSGESGRGGRSAIHRQRVQHGAWIAAAQEMFEDQQSRAARAPTVAATGPFGDLSVELQEALPGYRLIGEISRGGQGIVYRATQIATRRDVAIKVIRDCGARHAQAEARFEREVLILGQLKHPNIVDIIDSGAAAGCRYFIMDYISGWSLDEYLRIESTPIRQRVELFATICEALSVAHLRGVVHRDLKPGNIRVDRAGVPHLLDFGLARPAELDELLAGEARTETGDFVGSLPWASPEQVEGEIDQIDIRTDIYSLGVMLFSSLTGRMPYETVGSLRKVMDNICRADAPPLRRVNAGIDDELASIVAKCLRKSREERYQSAGDLARELRRYLAGEALEAKRDSSWYLLKKTIRRNRGRAAVAGLLVAVAAYSVGVLGYAYRTEARLHRESQEALGEARRQAKIAHAVNEFLNVDLLASASPERLGKDVTVREVVDKAAAELAKRFADAPEVRARLRATLGVTYLNLGEPVLAMQQLEDAYRMHMDVFGADDVETDEVANELARIYLDQSRAEESERLLRGCVAFRERKFGAEAAETLTARGNLGWLLAMTNRVAEGERLIGEVRVASERVNGPEHEQTFNWTNTHATVLQHMGRLEEAEPLHKRAVEMARRLYGPDHPDTFLALGNYAELLKQRGRYEESETLYRETLEGRRRVLGPTHPRTILTLNNLAVLYGRMRRDADAAAMLEEGLRDGPAQMGAEHSTLVSMRSNLAALYDRLGRSAEAEPLHRAALASAKATRVADHPIIGLYLSRLGRCLLRQEKLDEAEPLLLEAYPILTAASTDAMNAGECSEALARLYGKRGDADRRREWAAKAAD
ncbi:MAG: hypothetical protein AMXMBFR47_16060 [Planctomycetota bacterium]